MTDRRRVPRDGPDRRQKKSFAGEQAPPVQGTVRPRLFWSKAGLVACAEHAPRRDSAEWTDDRWREIGDRELLKRGLQLQCSDCASDHRSRVRAIKTQKS